MWYSPLTSMENAFEVLFLLSRIDSDKTPFSVPEIESSVWPKADDAFLNLFKVLLSSLKDISHSFSQCSNNDNSQEFEVYTITPATNSE